MTMIPHRKIRESVDNANRLIERYTRDYNAISQELKPEVVSERRAKIYNDFSSKIKDDLQTLRAATSQLKQERDQASDPFDALMRNGMASLQSMSAGESWLAGSLDKLPTAGIEKFTAQAIKTGSDGLKFGLFLHLTNEKSPEAARALDSLVASVRQSPQTQSFISDVARLERDVHKTLLSYEARPGSGKSMQSKRIETGHLLDKLDKIIVEADISRPAA